MKLFRWQQGRLPLTQGAYYILPLFVSKRLKMDLYILRVRPNTSIPPHVDPAPEGYTHLRYNISLGLRRATVRALVGAGYRTVFRWFEALNASGSSQVR